MDDTSIQFRLRLAQINGINLDEAAKKVTPEHLTPEYKAKLKELQDTAKTAQVARRNARDALEKANRDHDEAQKALFDHKTKDPNYFKRGNERLERSNQKAEAEHERKMKTDPNYRNSAAAARNSIWVGYRQAERDVRAAAAKLPALDSDENK